MGTYEWKPFTLLVSADEVEKEVLRIEAGKYYKTRDGRKVGPVSGCYPFFYVPEIHDYFYSNGRQWNTHESVNDIISEWKDETPSPIRTVTRREIVAGVYGPVDVRGVDEGGLIQIFIKPTNLSLMSWYSAEELREIAHTFNQIAEAMEEAGK